MKSRGFLPATALLLAASILRCAASPSSGEASPPAPLPRDPQFYPRAMRELVQELSAYARRVDPSFRVVPQNGLGLLTDDGTPAGALVEPYLAAINGVGQEELFYGYPLDDRPTPPEDTAYLLAFLRRVRDRDKTVLVIDYCRSPKAVADSCRRNAAEGFVCFAAPRRELDVIPSLPRGGPALNEEGVQALGDVANLLYLINPGSFRGVRPFVEAAAATNYDLLVVDAFATDPQQGTRWLTAAEVRSLQRKPSGARRLVLAYFSIGEAEDYRYYWRPHWDRRGDGSPDLQAPRWLESENPHWPGNYKVRYWEPEWRQILYGHEGAYLDGILARGYDGVYLDLVDAYLYFQERLSAQPR
ncbi:MAG: endo alpha-1,4 polygalactosaminidase [Spirochaetales bacterium]|nr:endo alpha-1,4 polygalactosaminidase [Spirochaetales bacterium]